MARPFFISFHTYGTWLHGHPEGSVDSFHDILGTPNLPPKPAFVRADQANMRFPPFKLDHEGRFVVQRTIEAVSAYRGWRIVVLNVRTNHLHVVLWSDTGPEKLLHDLKAWPTRRLRESGLCAPGRHVWADHGSTIWLNTANRFARAVEYVRDEQGPDLPQRRPRGWKREWEAPERTENS